MSDESIRDVATEIALWEGAARHLPVDEVREMASISLTTLAKALNAFNTAYLNEDDQDDDVLADQIMRVARQATAAAIFTLGASQRTQITAQHN
jgi:pyruvate kinase